MKLNPGIYEELLDHGLQGVIERHPELRSTFGKLDPGLRRWRRRSIEVLGYGFTETDSNSAVVDAKVLPEQV